jgi:cobaltochelatase CobT
MKQSFWWGLAAFFLIISVVMGEWTLQEAMLFNARCLDTACVEQTSNVANLRGGGTLLALLAFGWSVYYALCARSYGLGSLESQNNQTADFRMKSDQTEISFSLTQKELRRGSLELYLARACRNKFLAMIWLLLNVLVFFQSANGPLLHDKLWFQLLCVNVEFAILAFLWTVFMAMFVLHRASQKYKVAPQWFTNISWVLQDDGLLFVRGEDRMTLPWQLFKRSYLTKSFLMVERRDDLDLVHLFPRHAFNDGGNAWRVGINARLGHFNESSNDSANDYHAFTRKFDVTIEAKRLDDVLGPPTKSVRSAVAAAWQEFEVGLLSWKTKLGVIATKANTRIRATLSEQEFNDTVVSILVDQSGSMRGQKMILTAAAVDIAQDFLRLLGTKVEILGFTTIGWHGGKSRRRWKACFRPPNPGRLCDILHIVYRSAEDVGSGTGGWGVRSMLRPDLPKENVDGEALEWAASRLLARPERRKLLIVISDGAPVDDSTLHANGPHYLDRHLIEVIARLAARGDITIAALGIEVPMERYYSMSTTVKSPEDIGTDLLTLVERTMTSFRSG